MARSGSRTFALCGNGFQVAEAALRAVGGERVFLGVPIEEAETAAGSANADSQQGPHSPTGVEKRAQKKEQEDANRKDEPGRN